MKQCEDYEKRNAPAAQRFAEREPQCGSDATQRLADLTTQRGQCGRRLRDYAQQRHKMMAEASLPSSQRDQPLQSLLSRGFDANERRRLLNES